MEKTEPPVTEKQRDATGHRAVSFRDARWTGCSIIVGLLFLLGYRCLGFIDRQWLAQFPYAIVFAVTVLLPLVFLLVYPVVSQSPRPYSAEKPRAPTRWLVEFAIAVPVVFATLVMMAVVNYFVPRFAPGTSLTPEAIERMTYSAFAPMVVLWVVLSFTIGPISEEVFFRGFLYNAFRTRMPAMVAGLLQSVIFAVCHSYSPLQIGVVFLMGLILTGVYEWRKTLLTPTFVHMGINFTSASMVLLLMWLDVNQPMMGVLFEPQETACVIREVVPNSPAEEAGFMAGDEITSFNGQPIRNPKQLFEWIRLYRPGDAIPVKVMRDGEEREITVVLRRREEPEE